MIRITNIKENYTPLVTKGGSITIAFDYEPFYDIGESGDKIETNVGTWSVHTFTKRPSFMQLKNFILSEINKRVDGNILSGFKWNGMPVWLSTENQFNYKAAYDLAFQTNGASLPTVFKFGTTENPIYYKFDTLEELTDFYTKALTYINEQLAIGWYKKDSIDWSVYEEALKTL
jgi:hypothetical protein